MGGLANLIWMGGSILPPPPTFFSEKGRKRCEKVSHKIFFRLSIYFWRYSNFSQKVPNLDGGGSNRPIHRKSGLPSKKFTILKRVTKFQHTKKMYRVSQKRFGVAKKNFFSKKFFKKNFSKKFSFFWKKIFFFKIFRKNIFWQPWHFLGHPVHFLDKPKKILTFIKNFNFFNGNHFVSRLCVCVCQNSCMGRLDPPPSKLGTFWLTY